MTIRNQSPRIELHNTIDDVIVDLDYLAPDNFRFRYDGSTKLEYHLSDSSGDESWHIAPNKLLLGVQPGPGIYTGTGSPEGVVTARLGSIYLRNDSGDGVLLYVKESGSLDIGWVGK